MRSTIRRLQWVASAAIAIHFSGIPGYGQTYDYSAPPQRLTAPASSSEYRAATSWASYGNPSQAANSDAYLKSLEDSPAYYGAPGHPKAHAPHGEPGHLTGPEYQAEGILPGAPHAGLPQANGLSCDGPECEGAFYGIGCSPWDARCGWFGGAGGLAMTRDRDNFFAFSYATGDESVQLVNNRDVEIDVAGGVEARFGRYFCCGTSSLEFVFWTLVPNSQSYTLLGSDVVGDLNGIHNWDQLTYNGSTADSFVNDAVAHRIRREYEFQNYEINWNTYLPRFGNSGAWEVQTIAGFRIFRFGETLDFAADTVDASFTGAADEIHYLVDVDNRLYGFQLGGRSEYHLTDRFALTAKVLGGLYANDVDHHSRVGGSAGAAVVNNGPNNGEVFDIYSGKTDLAVMGELELGVLYRLGRNWEIGGGYRAMGISGVALTTNQIYPDLRGVNDVQEVDINGDLILHGGYFNLMYNY